MRGRRRGVRSAALTALPALAVLGLAVAASPSDPPEGRPAGAAGTTASLAGRPVAAATTVSGWTTTQTSAAPGQVLRASVVVTGPRWRRVTLQRKVGDTWTTVAAARTDAVRRAVLTWRAPSGSSWWRLAVPAAEGSPAATTGARRVVTTIDRSDRAAVVAAYRSRWVPLLSVPTGWTGSTSTCTAGSVSAAFTNATLAAVNYMRDVSGLPSVTRNPSLTTKAQKAALVMAANGSLSHSPPSSWRCWSADADAGAGTSNLALGASGPSAVALYMDDGGVPSAGHRRWVAFSRLATIGHGATSGSDALTVLTPQSSAAPARPWTAWPSPGYFPKELEPSGMWSFSSTDPGADLSRATVRVVNASGTSLGLTKKALQPGYGDPTLVWQLAAAPSHGTATDARYTVTVSGVRLSSGATVSYRYGVVLVRAS